MKILLVGCDEPSAVPLSPRLRGRGFTTHRVLSPEEVRRQLTRGGCDVVVLDWETTGEAAAEILAQTNAFDRPAIVLTRDATAVPRLHEAGARACLVKPFAVRALEVALRGGAQVNRHPPRREPLPGPAEGPIIETRNPSVNRLLNVAWRAAESDASVLLLGESGTGKSALAAAIHQRSRRKSGAWVTVHCPCLHPQLLESQLFGHVKGAFTGAVMDTVGRVGAADGGTLFLDEVGDLPLELQPKLLRLLQDREFERVGDCETRRVDIRVIAATHQNLAQEVAAGRFREDLYYRLNVVALRVPPLRRRAEDILPCARAFLAQLRARTGRGPTGFTAAAQTMLQSHCWPGNLRELRNTIERAAILCRGELIDRTDLLLDPRNGRAPVPQVGEFVTLEELEEAHIREVLARVGNYRQAAQILGVDKSTLYRRIRDCEHAAEDTRATAAG